jgi:Leucine-rich repeat (LRR) protein
MMNNNIEELNRFSFENCRNLENLFMNLNRITIIMPLTFTSSPILGFIGLSTNRLTFIHQTSFIGTRLQGIDLADNLLTVINPMWLAPISNTLMGLDLLNNRITSVSSNTFASLRHLEALVLNYNRIENIPDDAFDALVNLNLLSLGHCGLSSLNPRWFQNLSNLTDLFLPSNEVAELPAGIFSPVNALRLLDIYDNRLETLSAQSFGGSAQSITTIIASKNAINAVDPGIIGQNLDNLYLAENVCVNRNFANVTGTADEVRAALSQCFNNFPTQ